MTTRTMPYCVYVAVMAVSFTRLINSILPTVTGYQQGTSYFINFSAWAHEISISEQNEVIKVEDEEAIRYHRAFNDIVAANDGKVPDDLQQQIAEWQPETKEQMAPVEINLGHMCAYLFGDTLGQEDEAMSRASARQAANCLSW